MCKSLKYNSWRLVAMNAKNCPVCKAEMKLLPGSFKFTASIEKTKSFSVPSTMFVCTTCGNVQQFLDIKEIRPLL